MWGVFGISMGNPGQGWWNLSNDVIFGVEAQSTFAEDADVGKAGAAESVEADGVFFRGDQVLHALHHSVRFFGGEVELEDAALDGGCVDFEGVVEAVAPLVVQQEMALTPRPRAWFCSRDARVSSDKSGICVFRWISGTLFTGDWPDACIRSRIPDKISTVGKTERIPR